MNYNLDNIISENINLNTWSKFKISDIFSVEIAKSIDKPELKEEQNGINYITRKTNNNGLEFKVSNDFPKLINKGKAISLAMVGSYKGTCFWQNDDFYSSQNMLLFRNNNINNKIALFLVTVLTRKFRVINDYNAINKSDVLKDYILLPSINNSNTPDWNYMENYIKQLEKPINIDYLNNINSNLKCINYFKENTSSWKLFKISDYFNVECSKYHNPDNYKSGKIPYVARTTFNNGVVSFVDTSEKLYDGNCIIIGAESAQAFYQEKPFITGNKVYRIYETNKSKLNKEIALFLCTLLNKEGKKYSYANAWVSEKVKETEIYLPAITNPDGTFSPDWNYMENYIKNLNDEVFK